PPRMTYWPVPILVHPSVINGRVAGDQTRAFYCLTVRVACVSERASRIHDQRPTWSSLESWYHSRNQLPSRTGMRPTGNIWIPDPPPTLRFRAEVPLFWASSLDLPIPHRGMVLVTCGISQRVVAAPVLAGIDALTGEQRLRVDVRLQHPREVSASLPGT